jgi:hypothetical protein
LGWHVCTGVDVQQERITVAQSTAFVGAFAFDSANDCGNCHTTCLGAMTGTSVNGFCAVSATDYTDPDLECMGSDCRVRPGMTSCLLNGRTDAPSRESRKGCEYYDGLSGVVCCRETGCADRTREGLTDHRQWPRIAVSAISLHKSVVAAYRCHGYLFAYLLSQVCGGEWSGQIGSLSAAALCASGWHVCTGDDVRAEGISLSAATGFDGCFAFDSANNCGNCHSTCLGAMSGTSVNGTRFMYLSMQRDVV